MNTPDDPGLSSNTILAMGELWNDRTGQDVSAALEVIHQRIEETEEGSGDRLELHVPTKPIVGQDRYAGQRRERRWVARGILGRYTLRGQTAFRAAAAVIALGIVVVFAVLKRGMFRMNVSPMRAYVTVAGQRGTVTLADGSQVLLGPATTLSVFRDVSNASLDAYVSGEAQFTVAHDHHRTFRVHIGHALARVLGTTFLVRQYRNDPAARVVVVDGRVSLVGVYGSNRMGTEYVLAPSSLGVVDDSGHVRVTPHIGPDDYAEWVTGQLVFRDTPARDVITELGRAYGVDIHLTDSTVATRMLTWSVSTTQQSLPDVLEALADVLGVHAIRSGRNITLVPGASPIPKARGSLPPFTLERQHGR